MSIDLTDDILQDFLVEAGEIIEQLGEQLVQLEKTPDDYDLLNGIFRGFHTVKGGAGFLSITALVTLCHKAEDVFNILRNGERKVDSEMMDVMLKVYDKLRGMFESISQGADPEPASQEMINSLVRYLSPAQPVTASNVEPAVIKPIENKRQAPVAAEKSAADKKVDGGDDITDSEFEDLLDQLHGTAVPGEVAGKISDGANISGASSPDLDGDITEDEFQSLLDQLHGSGIPGEKPAGDLINDPPVAVSTKVETASAIKADDHVAAVRKPDSTEIDKGVKKDAQQTENTVRVDTKRLDDIMNLVGELVLVRNRLLTIQALAHDEEMTSVASNLDIVTSDLQTAVMKTRMQPIKKVFGRFPRVVRDLARSLNKDVELELIGEETDLDKNLVEALADPLIHLVRNAVDHGVEMPDVREKSGKSRRGKIILSASQEGDHILLRIKDDGAGMDVNKLKKIAVDKGVIDAETAQRLSEKEAFNLIFMPGFSTKEVISDVSGRGVGMDVVKTKISQLNGAIDITSAPGKGSTIDIKVPLTLAIMPTLMVVVNEQVYALPLGSVVEIFNLDLNETNTVSGQKIVLVRNKPLPIYFLRDWLTTRGEPPAANDNHVVMVNATGRQVGFVVDKLLGQEEVVIKPLGSMLHGTPGMAGATITGNGKISLILDIPSLLYRYARR
ncbi:MAG: chemotaxis protein CheA [Gammaproteobacteria bacterium]|nr:chemotaxis protein CheA [Gammaproteobacteria bacterium]